ncbi:leucyl-tRNA synthetase [Bacillus sp. OxB-1]|uniref:hypothetical protein n=1 Tax=Bacillus sp. (strain OxB-1) TaxID=98228 RepID=UPI000581B9E7|nr:hypothetical protein [Bacillus sp. OxB-1]BAQ11022.1 leucyl-tRNA synthetase [Bacillus sp. OxB-1]
MGKSYVVMLCTMLLLLGACGKPNSTAMDNSGTSKGSATTENGTSKPGQGKEHAEAIDMIDYFPPDGTQARFEGVGNEFAEFEIEVAHPTDHYVIIHENNGGAIVRRIFRLEPNAINILEEQVVENKEDFPDLPALEEMTPTGVYLKKPFTEGTTFGFWTIVDTDATVETPYQTFDNALVIEEKGKDYINRKYFVKGIGEVKRESVMQTTDGEEFTVTSSLESIEDL